MILCERMGGGMEMSSRRHDSTQVNFLKERVVSTQLMICFKQNACSNKRKLHMHTKQEEPMSTPPTSCSTSMYSTCTCRQYVTVSLTPQQVKLQTMHWFLIKNARQLKRTCTLHRTIVKKSIFSFKHKSA